MLLRRHPEAASHPTSKSVPIRVRIASAVAEAILLVLGLALLMVGLFAFQLGLDNDPGWGRGRVMMSVLGGGLILGAAAIWFWEAMYKTGRVALSGKTPHRAVGAAQRTYPAILGVVYSGAGVAIAILVSIWFLTSGTLFTWMPYTRYFDMQASAFLAGQTSLLEQPSVELRALENPYDWRMRESIPHLWDASYFQEKYYLYWGPIPALLAVIFKTIVPTVVEDQYLLMFFIAGLNAAFALLLLHLRQELYPDAPPWTLLPLILLAAFSTPVFWLVNRPSVYETAIAGGQFFFILGLYFASRAITADRGSKGWLFSAGVMWGLAAGCRLNLLLATAVFLFIIVVRTWQQKRWRAGLNRLFLIGLPVALSLAGLGWYNFIRFGSPFETGHRYQLTGPALPQNYQDVTSLSYAIPNLYNYLIRPFEISQVNFPFVFAPYINEDMWPVWIRLPEQYYYSEPVVGLLASVPAVWLAILPSIGGLRRIWRWLWEEPAESRNPAHPAEGTIWLLAASGVVGLLAPLLIFISSSMRYLGDVAPVSILLSALGLWWGLRFFQSTHRLRVILLITAVILLLTSVAFGLLVNFQNGDKRFEANNPALYYAISNFLSLPH